MDQYGEGTTGYARAEQRAWGGRKGSRPGAVLSELFVEVEREPLQVEVSGVRVLFELLGFLLKLLNVDF